MTRQNPFFIFSLGRTTITLYRAFFRAHSVPLDARTMSHKYDVTNRAPPIRRARMLVLNIPDKCCTQSIMTMSHMTHINDVMRKFS